MSKPIPKNTRNWIRESGLALRKAEQKIEKSSIREDELYLVAVDMAASRRKVSEAQKQSALKFVSNRILCDRSNEDPGDYEFEFILSYLDAHIDFGYLDENASEEIMLRISDNAGQLFEDEGDDA